MFSRLEMMLVHDAHHGVVHRDMSRLASGLNETGTWEHVQIEVSSGRQTAGAEEVPFRCRPDGVL